MQCCRGVPLNQKSLIAVRWHQVIWLVLSKTYSIESQFFQGATVLSSAAHSKHILKDDLMLAYKRSVSIRMFR